MDVRQYCCRYPSNFTQRRSSWNRYQSRRQPCFDKLLSVSRIFNQGSVTRAIFIAIFYFGALYREVSWKCLSFNPTLCENKLRNRAQPFYPFSLFSIVKVHCFAARVTSPCVYLRHSYSFNLTCLRKALDFAFAAKIRLFRRDWWRWLPKARLAQFLQSAICHAVKQCLSLNLKQLIWRREKSLSLSTCEASRA